MVMMFKVSVCIRNAYIDTRDETYISFNHSWGARVDFDFRVHAREVNVVRIQAGLGEAVRVEAEIFRVTETCLLTSIKTCGEEGLELTNYGFNILPCDGGVDETSRSLWFASLNKVGR